MQYNFIRYLWQRKIIMANTESAAKLCIGCTFFTGIRMRCLLVFLRLFFERMAQCMLCTDLLRGQQGECKQYGKKESGEPHSGHHLTKGKK